MTRASHAPLLGARNWWLPAWLDRIIPNLRVEGELPDIERAEQSDGAA